jgi:hypothetical protein
MRIILFQLFLLFFHSSGAPTLSGPALSSFLTSESLITASPITDAASNVYFVYQSTDDLSYSKFLPIFNTH